MAFPNRTIVDEKKLFPDLPNNTIGPIRPLNDDLWGKDGDSFFYNGTVKKNCPAGLVWNSTKKECGSSSKPPTPTPPAPKPPTPKPPTPKPPTPKPPPPDDGKKAFGDNIEEAYGLYKKERDAGKTAAVAVKTLQDKYTGVGPDSQKLLEDRYMASKPPVPNPPGPSTDRSDKGLKPTMINVGGVQHAYQSPANPKGLVVFLHGCSRSIYGGWPASANPNFFGMPEDVGRTKQCLRAGYAILYVAPNDSKTNCFSAKEGKDPGTTISVIDQVRKVTGTANKPLYLGGCSAGGGMIQRMVADGKIKCDGMFNESSTSGEPSNKTPASLWTVLATEKEHAAGTAMANMLKKVGKPAEVLVSPRRQITATFFADQMASISVANSAKIADSLKKSKAIDASGYVSGDIKNNKAWYNNLGKDVPIPETKLPFWNSGIAQAMLTAQAVHDACSMYMTTFLEWAESGFKTDINELAKKYAVTKPAYVIV